MIRDDTQEILNEWYLKQLLFKPLPYILCCSKNFTDIITFSHKQLFEAGSTNIAIIWMKKLTLKGWKMHM